MKLFKYLFLPTLAALGFIACEEEENAPSRAILPEETTLTIPAAGTTRTVTIYADGTWVADVTDTWLSIDPTSGEGSVEVNLTVDANVSDNEREAKIVILGSSKLGEVEITVKQKMDRFREIASQSVTEALKLKAGDLAKLSECQVMKTTSGGFIVSDGTSSIMVQGTASVAEGDKLTLTGDVVEFNGITAIKLEDAFPGASAEVKYPAAKEVDFENAYAPGKVEYINATLSYGSGGDLSLDGKKVAVAYNPTNAQNEYAFHLVKLTGYYVGEVNNIPAILITDIEDLGMEAIPYMQFEIETSAFNSSYSSTIGTTHKFNANVGSGYIEYIPYDLANTDPAGVWKMDVSGNDPRATGPWPGDYWDFVGTTAVKANSEFKIQFGSRVSATGHKYWMLEVLDGSVWKPIGEVKVSTDMPDGENVEYTHAMNKDGGTNIIIDESFSITKNMDKLEIRFRCLTNWQANGSGPLAQRNTGTARLAVASDGSKGDASVVAPQPSILITKMGDGAATVDPEPEYANIELSSSLLTFEGTPDAPKTLTVKSDRDFTATSSVSWLTLDPAAGSADESVKINVTCAPSDLVTLRQGKIIVTSGDSRAEINVVQSAAGGNLDPLISLATGNSITVLGEGQEFSASVLSNVDYQVEILDEWLSEITEPATKAIVETSSHTFKAAANMTGAERTGHIRFYNEAKNLETVLTVNQENFVPRVTVTTNHIYPAVSGNGGSLNYKIDANIPFTVSIDGSWVKFPQTEGPAGVYTVPVTFEANTSDATRSAVITISNDEYGYSTTVEVNQYGKGVIFADNFDWVEYFVDMDIAKGNTQGDGMADKKAYSIGSSYNLTGFSATLTDMGYEALFPSSKTVYVCKGNYLKFSKTNNTNGVRLPAMVFGSSSATLSFDWAPNGTDSVELEVEVEGNGTVNGSKSIVLTRGEETWTWNSVSLEIAGADADTRIVLRPTCFTGAAVTDGLLHRWYLDNILVK
ncbi:MAG: BACON domain-containing protein [Candidatus Cryptobacteroides sp.]